MTRISTGLIGCCTCARSFAPCIAFQVTSTAVNVYGHSGYELYPPAWPHHWLGRWINTSIAHNTHHAIARYNYGLYFLFWDRWLGTLDPAYERRYQIGRPRRGDLEQSAGSAL